MTKSLWLQRVVGVLGFLFIVFLPLQTRWIIHEGSLGSGSWEYGTLALYATDILLFGIVFVMIVQQKKILHVTPFHMIAIILLIMAFASCFFADAQDVALFGILRMFVGALVFFCFTQQILSRSTYMWAALFAGIVESLLAYWQFITQRVFASSLLGMASQDPMNLGAQVVEGSMGRVLRSYGTFPHPNILAGFLVVVLLWTLGNYLATRYFVSRVWLGISMGILSMGLVLSFSRQAWIALFVALMLMIAIAFIREHIFPARITVGVLCILAPFVIFVIAFPQLFSTRMNTDTRLEKQSINERQESIHQTFDILRDHWAFGVGVGNSPYAAYQRDVAQNDIQESYRYQPVHNIPLLMFEELGIIGLMTNIFILVMFVRNFINAAHDLPKAAIASALIALFIIGMFDHYFWSLHPGVLIFWMTLAISH